MGPPLTGVRVLIADDDPRIRLALTAAITRLGCDVRSTDDGAPAIALAAQTPFDLAVIDLGMPTSGVEVVRSLKERYGPAVHVEILTGADDPTQRNAAFDAGADGYLVKPTSIPELQKRLIAATKSQQAYIEARMAREHADRLLAWGSEAAALLAHDLNNGLAVALANMSFLSQSLAVDEDQGQALASTLRALRRMSGLVANFVDIARFEDDALAPRKVQVRIRDLLTEVMALHAPSIARQIQHEVTCDPELIGSFDEALIARVLHNLVGNALRYCNPGGVIRLSAARYQALPGEPPALEIRVHNTGPDIPTAVAGRLFGKYAVGKDGQRGMGLYFCRLACEAHGGQVRHEASPTGPTFVLRLPVA